MSTGTAKKKAPSKTQILGTIAEKTELSKKQVAAVFDVLTELVENEISKKNGSGQFTIPGLCKILVHTRKAQPAKMGVPNPFKPGEFRDIPAKPARNVIKVRPLKSLKEMAPPPK